MIAYIKGTLEHISEGLIIVETGGIGYSVQVPSSAVQKLPAIGSPVTVHRNPPLYHYCLRIVTFCTVESFPRYSMSTLKSAASV